jgi:hypothetical protein
MTTARARGSASGEDSGTRESGGWPEHARLVGGAFVPLLVVALTPRFALARLDIGFILGSIVIVVALNLGTVRTVRTVRARRPGRGI